jgi:hypothetical protein
MTFAKEDKQNIKKIMYQFLPDFLFAPRGELSDDEEGNFGQCFIQWVGSGGRDPRGRKPTSVFLRTSSVLLGTFSYFCTLEVHKSCFSPLGTTPPDIDFSLTEEKL